MKVLICGDRNWSQIEKIWKRMKQLPYNCTVITGGAKGADTIADNCAQEFGFNRQVIHALWAVHGKAAGPIRNRQMLDLQPDLVIAFHSDIEHSRGTRDTITEAERRGIPVELIT